ncbi:cupin domain-containing protein [Macrococcoides caseolyticum]|uniref:cupin domain-containing protein n=1 Tax=Macrococcoides caseolyticum TaxID=69966 RepID=UPI001F312586|nr:cupin domain-containing protein [Macrococcus caseolyticus]MCE4956589.1 cupin domain-containing protein [Macrococcus caseolyticus]
MNKEQLIRKLNLQPHPEGGYYYESYKSTETTQDGRLLYTSIYFLLEAGNISHFHRIDSDELWYYQGGDSLTVHMIHPNGQYEAVKLGLDVENGEVPQFLVPKNTIFASSVEDDNAWSFVGCMVSPGFTFEGFELFTKDALKKDYPHLDTVIDKYALTKIENK